VDPFKCSSSETSTTALVTVGLPALVVIKYS
jgi:hypothetical protein